MDRWDLVAFGIYVLLSLMFLDLLFFRVVPPPKDLLLPYSSYSESFFWQLKTSQLNGYDLILAAKVWTVIVINLSFPLIALAIREDGGRLLSRTQMELIFLVLVGGVLALYSLKQAPYRDTGFFDPFYVLYLLPTFILFEMVVRWRVKLVFHFLLQVLLMFYSFWIAFFVLVGD